MVRLIRLTSDTNDGRFINNFDSNIELSSYSQIAFKGCNIDVPSPEITIDGTNGDIRYSSGLGGFVGVGEIDHGVYNIKENIGKLNEEIETTFNNLSNLVGANDRLERRIIGQQWKAGANSDDKYQIQYKTSNNINLLSGEWKKSSDVNVDDTTDPNDLIFKNLDTASTDDAYVVSKHPINKGGFRMLQNVMYIPTTSAGLLGGAVCGISDQNFAKTGDEPELALLDIYLRTGDDITTYFICDGKGEPEEAIVGQTVADDDTFGIIKLGDTYHAVAYDSAGAEKFNVAFDFKPTNWLTDFYGVIILRDDTVVIHEVQSSLDPYSYTGTPPNKFFQSAALNIIGVPLLAKENASADISESLSLFLGFNNPYLQNQNSGSDLIASLGPNQIFTASIELVHTVDSYLIELMNLDLESYDGYTEQRKNILTTIEYNEFFSQILYEPSQYVYLDLNNKQPINLRNISARIVTNTFRTVATEGLNTITIYIKDGPEVSRDRAFIN